jgi:hypothetical protein
MTQTAPSRGNTLRPLRASNLVVDLVELGGVSRKFVQCPCGRSTQVKRNELAAHNTLDEKRCPNSRRALINDLDDADWAAAYDRTARHIERSRASRPQFSKPKPPIGSAVAHLARPRLSHTARTSGHSPEALAELDRAAKDKGETKKKPKAR